VSHFLASPALGAGALSCRERTSYLSLLPGVVVGVDVLERHFPTAPISGTI